MNKEVYIGEMSLLRYPDDQVYSPSDEYPEYCFSELSKENNEVYKIIRQGFFKLGFDSKNFGKSTWNPLGNLINKGDTVLIKPNWVFHENVEKVYHNMDCMVTHPSIIRAVIDYVYIALGNTGRIIIGDSPIQLCDFKALMKNNNYNQLWQYYRDKNVKIEVVDFRGLVAKIEKNLTFSSISNDEVGFKVKLDRRSAFFNNKKFDDYRITNYEPEELMKYHSQYIHEYIVHPLVLEADVVINLPKPKAHRKAGITACMKNIVGINARKECLPHHTKYSASEGGDEYLKKNIIRSVSSDLMDRYLTLAYKQNKNSKYIYTFLKVIDKLGKMVSRDNYSEGSWFGNDTIWRTIIDLNIILTYCDRLGVIKNSPQRKIFNICDMVVVGEKEGPLEPSPKSLGIILMGSNTYLCDIVISKIFGCDYKKIKYLEYINKLEKPESVSKLNIIYNESITNFDNFLPSPNWNILFSSGWDNYLRNNSILLKSINL